MCGVGRDGPFRQDKTEVQYEQHRNVGDHRSYRVLRHLRQLGVLQVLGPPPSRMRDLNEAEIAASWRKVSETLRQLFHTCALNGIFDTIHANLRLSQEVIPVVGAFE